MSRKRSRPDPRELKKRKQRKSQAFETSGDSKSDHKSARKTSVLDEKNHVNPLTAAVIIIAFVVLGGFACWLYLKPTEPPAVADNGETKTGQQSPQNNNNEQLNSGAGNNQSPGWNRDVSPDAGWQTEDDQKKQWESIDDPSRDGWETEVLTTKVTDIFKSLKKILNSDKALDVQSLSGLADAKLSVRPLRPTELKTTYKDDSLHIQRATKDLEASSIPAKSGIKQFAEQLNSMVGQFAAREQIRAKIKVFRVVPDDDENFATYQTVELFGPDQNETGWVEENAMWRATWTMIDGQPVMQSIGAVEFETVHRLGKPMFADCTEAVFANAPSYQNQLLQGYNHWLDRGQFHRFLSVLSNPGIAVSDVNGDGLPDIYVCQESGLPNLLFLQKPDGTLQDVSKASGADFLQNSTAALVVDLNNDGHQDLVVGVTGGVVIASGDSTGKFKIQKIVDTEDHVLSLSAADFNLDGKLDIYVGVYFPNGIDGAVQSTVVGGAGGEIAYADANDDGGSNSLLQNDSAGEQWRFEDVTNAVGLDQNNRRMTLAASWEDFDNDGDQDLYVANDYGLNNLYRNDRNADGQHRFTDVAKQYKAEDTAFGMSVAWSDYNRDGWMDLYIGNMFSYAGHRITYQNQFRKNESETIRQGYQRFARGSTLLKNLGSENPDKLTFDDRSLTAGANKARWAWGSRLADFNNDGWDDIVAVNGYISTDDTGDC